MWNIFLYFLSVVQSANHVLVIIADDFGWGDVSMHGSGAIQTPNLDGLAKGGINLTHYYTQHICTPTRSALLSSRYPIHTGLQTNVIAVAQPSGLHKNETLFPEYMEECGIGQRHMIGKWHVGHGHDWMVPWRRGFQTYSGYLAGAEDHYTRMWCMEGTEWCGVDYSEHSDSFTGPTNETWGIYSADLYLKKMSEVIDSIDPTKSSFVYFAPQHVHYPLQALEKYLTKYEWILDYNRRRYAAMVSALDEMIGDVVKLYDQKGLLKDTIGWFVADNGGETRDGGNNWPLSGQKWTLLEGGVRATGFLFGGKIPIKSAQFTDLVHVSDIMPTLLDAAGCKTKFKNPIDGVSHWDRLSGNTMGAMREELLHNIDPTKNDTVTNDTRVWNSKWDVRIQAAIRWQHWKLITGDPGFTDGAVPEFPVPPPEWNNTVSSPTLPVSQNTGRPLHENYKHFPLNTKLVHLFNIMSDPTESTDLSDHFPSIVEKLLDRLLFYNSTMIPPQLPNLDPNSNPVKHNGFWYPWLK